MISIRQLVWDAWNVPHIARHDVLPQEVEEVCHGPFVIREGYEGRVIVLGPTAAGRFLAVILDPLGEDGYFPVTARPVSRAERRLFEEEKQGGTA
jgi:uncharacterized DUF497 family protein